MGLRGLSNQYRKEKCSIRKMKPECTPAVQKARSRNGQTACEEMFTHSI